MTYCVGIMTRQGLVMASDSRTNAGYDDVNVCRKMHTFVRPGERAFLILTSGSLSITQSVITRLRRDFDVTGFSPEVQKKITYDNVTRLYGLN